ncbi:hypothetical protein VE04_00085 [Pseudogymnoascus sp. 24MN13]|nr:hypothetical protein VE04_00085 [Pseudogymnoascus sp. 24MN13]
MRRRTPTRIVCLILASVLLTTTLVFLRDGKAPASIPKIFSPQSSSRDTEYNLATPTPPTPTTGPGDHPIRTLIANANADFEALKARQSTSLTQAIAEYKRRYGLSPPPNYDKWYAFAKARKVVLVDEFDTIHDLLLPFRGLPPSVLRARVTEALGHDNMLIALQIRQGNVTHTEGGQSWVRDALKGMTKEFTQYLPDMDLAFNVHDEPRVAVPHDDLQRLVANGKEGIETAMLNEKPRNEWSSHADLVKGIKEVPTSRFNYFSHQSTWAHSKLSCPPDSPSRSLLEVGEVPDVNNESITTPLGFITNQTAYSDICNSPSFSKNYGFFASANSFNVAQDLIPIFSQSKISSFQDIIYPPPWYWYDMVPYNATKDIPWAEKQETLYWRGGTTGGCCASERGAAIIEDSATEWTEKSTAVQDHKDLFDIKFTEVGQCDAGDCTAQREAFHVLPKVDPNDAWRSRYLLDMDGNAFSGRFYSFLQSGSAVLKMGISRERLAERVREWVHYVPLSLHGRDWVEAMRWITDGGAGGGAATEEGKALAMRSTEWAGRALRNADLEVWFFRLLLEYGRVVDDARESIGFAE